MITQTMLERATNLLNKPKSVAFLSEAGTLVEVRFATLVLAAECREHPEHTLEKHQLIKVLTDPAEAAEALFVGETV